MSAESILFIALMVLIIAGYANYLYSERRRGQPLARPGDVETEPPSFESFEVSDQGHSHTSRHDSSHQGGFDGSSHCGHDGGGHGGFDGSSGHH